MWKLHKMLAIHTWMQAQSNNWNYNSWKHCTLTVGSMPQCIFSRAKDYLECNIMAWEHYNAPEELHIH